MVEVALALGMVASLLASELFGLASAGLVVPGYLALYLDQPGRVAATIIVAVLTYAIVRYGIARVIVLYGRRRFTVTVLTGFIVNMAALQLPLVSAEAPELRAVGFIVPGLIANTALAQGPWLTLGVTLLVATVVRLLLLLLAYV